MRGPWRLGLLGAASLGWRALLAEARQEEREEGVKEEVKPEGKEGEGGRRE